MNACSARALLGVSPSATTGQIKRAFRRLALAAHPDRGGDASAFQRLVDAQNVLLAESAPASRSRWIDAPTADRRPTTFAEATRRRSAEPVRTSTPRHFGDVLAEKLAAA